MSLTVFDRRSAQQRRRTDQVLRSLMREGDIYLVQGQRYFLAPVGDELFDLLTQDNEADASK